MALQAKTKWKEELYVFDEAGRSFLFDCGWGVTPPVAYVPFETDWRGCVPEWLHRNPSATDVPTRAFRAC